MAPSNPPFRAEHLGSLLRPKDLLQKRSDVGAGKATAAELEAVEDKAIREVVQLQKDCGFHAVRPRLSRFPNIPSLQPATSSARASTVDSCFGAPSSRHWKE